MSNHSNLPRKSEKVSIKIYKTPQNPIPMTETPLKPQYNTNLKQEVRKQINFTDSLTADNKENTGIFTWKIAIFIQFK